MTRVRAGAGRSIKSVMEREDKNDECLKRALLDSNGKPIEGVIINPDSIKVYGNNCC